MKTQKEEYLYSAADEGAVGLRNVLFHLEGMCSCADIKKCIESAKFIAMGALKKCKEDMIKAEKTYTPDQLIEDINKS